MQVTELMTRNPECLTENDTVQRAAQRMRELDVGLLPVVADADNTQLRGVLTDRDIATRHVADGHDSQSPVGEIMTRDDLHTVSPTDDVDTVMERMRAGKVRRIPVTEDDRVVGIIAQADLAVETGDDQAEAVERTVEKISEPAEPTR